MAIGSLLFVASATGAQAGAGTAMQATDVDTEPATAADQIRIVEFAGLLDPVLQDFLVRELRAAEADGVVAVVLQVDSAGSVVDDDAFAELARVIVDLDPVVAMWVGPSGSQARGGSAELLGLADLVGVAQGSRIGETGPARLPDEFAPAFGDATARLVDNDITAAEAIELGIAVGGGSAASEEQLEAALETNSVLRQFVEQIPGYTAPVTGEEDASLVTEAQFRQLPLSGQLFHTAASPELAYLFFVGGLALLVFELYTAGVGVAGAIGVVLLVAGSYGVAVLPTRAWAVVLLILSLVAMAVDIQTNVPRLYSAVGVVLFVLGSWFLFDGVSMSWVTLGFGIIGAILYAYTGMPSMVRTRFSTPTIGRKWMIGSMGEALTSVSPEGLVRIDTAEWRAITNRATPIEAGARVRVVGIDRLLLEVEPEEGGARDYRERGGSDGDARPAPREPAGEVD